MLGLLVAVVLLLLFPPILLFPPGHPGNLVGALLIVAFWGVCLFSSRIGKKANVALLPALVVLLIIFPPEDPNTLIAAWMCVAFLGVLFIAERTSKQAPPINGQLGEASGNLSISEDAPSVKSRTTGRTR